jgi:tagatose-1,6-bisphosphate aldolase non-catalytic subunit AgaZ/GatZ
MTTCFGYTRVSTVKQGEGVSLEVQKEEIARYAEKHGLTISRWFEEKETAAKSGRPIFDAKSANYQIRASLSTLSPKAWTSSPGAAGSQRTSRR